MEYRSDKSKERTAVTAFAVDTNTTYPSPGLYFEVQAVALMVAEARVFMRL